MALDKDICPPAGEARDITVRACIQRYETDVRDGIISFGSEGGIFACNYPGQAAGEASLREFVNDHIPFAEEPSDVPQRIPVWDSLHMRWT